MKTHAMALLLVSVLTMVMLAAALTELRQPTPAITVGDQPMLAKTSGDVIVKSVSGKYKYKSEDVQDAEQGWAVAGECPTTMTTLDPNSRVTLSGNAFGRMRADSQMQSFIPADQQCKLNKKGTSMTVKFPDRYAARQVGILSSGHHAIPNFGSFKMLLKCNKDGQQVLRFMYQIKKASDAGLMTDTNDYSQMKEYVQSNGTVKTTTTVNGSLKIGDEPAHRASQDVNVKMTKNAAAYKLCR